MNSIVENSVTEYIEKKSLFITSIKKVSSVKEANDFLDEMRIKYSDATHNVYSYRVIENGMEYIKFNDDGEPSNTAGKPCYEILKILDVVNVVVCITRYFGGIKLGANGLIRAYSKATKLGLENSKLEEFHNYLEYMLIVDYKDNDKIKMFFNEENINIISSSYTDKINYRIKIKENLKEKLENLNYVMLVEI